MGEVDDARVRRGQRVDRVVGNCVDPLVGSELAEVGTALVGLPSDDLQLNQAYRVHARTVTTS